MDKSLDLKDKIIKKFIGPLDQDDYENIISLIKK